MTEQARDTRSQQKTSLMFVNHASLLIKQGDRYLLTDPWHLRVGFGSWLPTFQQYVTRPILPRSATSSAS
jgi:L-ascorbate metabolism protein UlaG (beta-lactamase superfamily)